MNTFYNYAKAINKIMNQNKEAKTQAERVAVINRYNHNGGLIEAIKKNATNVDDKSNGLMAKNNRYLTLLIQLNDWILSGKSSENNKAYFSNSYKKFNDKPQEIKDTAENNARIYRGHGNKFKGVNGALIPTKAELKDGNIKDLYNGIIELKNKKHVNRFTKSKAVHQMRDDLNLALTNARGLDQGNRVDNTVTPKQSITTPNFDSKDYIKFLLQTRLDEITDENVRTDKIDINNALGHKDNILTDLETFNQTETANRNNVSRFVVGRKLNTTTKRLLKSFN